MAIDLTRRGLLAGSTALALPGLALPGPATAQDSGWPRRTIRLIIPFPPGGTTDLIGRLLAERLSARLGQTVVVENRAGAGGNIGADSVAKSDPDGYTFLMASIGTASINYAVYGPRMPYKPQDLAAVGLVIRVANVLLAAKDQPIRDAQEMIAAAKRQPGRLNYGSSGSGGSPHACMEFLATRTGIKLQHVPYRGSGPMLTELVAGRIELGMDNIPSALSFIRNGQIRALAVTSRERSPVMPEVPTLHEAGIADFDATAWFGVQAAAATPAPIIARMGREIDAVARDPEWIAKMREFAAEPPRLTPQGGTTPEAFAAFIREEITRWAEVARVSGMVVE
ncbi:tripartite tricarboxylate transporter substrate binding protein [Roseomonas sp. SSH11]|uniref:Tripartite tricarboxylate transporter substrate binding protein n=1 Tax=Pararoseomonas baculiformis TaxID=2820812 RepID=A0ABS4ACC4_9PROT|nr:tripartite tricarboxylate transporter substrate binding protein [Pararoseomonas baculiformis]MBP0444672.1 tripartite tricarboxylate transporter substrate binding protein [Pararoseomonas baculiformis]